MVQWVKDPVLSLQRLRSLLWCGFDPWPGNFCIPLACFPPRPPKKGIGSDGQTDYLGLDSKPSTVWQCGLIKVSPCASVFLLTAAGIMTATCRTRAIPRPGFPGCLCPLPILCASPRPAGHKPAVKGSGATVPP